jgi:hypothetical protein
LFGTAGCGAPKTGVETGVALGTDGGADAVGAGVVLALFPKPKSNLTPEGPAPFGVPEGGVSVGPNTAGLLPADALVGAGLLNENDGVELVAVLSEPAGGANPPTLLSKDVGAFTSPIGCSAFFWVSAGPLAAGAALDDETPNENFGRAAVDALLNAGAPPKLNVGFWVTGCCCVEVAVVDVAGNGGAAGVAMLGNFDAFVAGTLRRDGA